MPPPLRGGGIIMGQDVPNKTDLRASCQHHDTEQTGTRDTSCGLPVQSHKSRGVDRRTSYCSEPFAWRNLCSSRRKTSRSGSLQYTPTTDRHSADHCTLSPSRRCVSTHRPQGAIIVGIYMSSNIYYLLLLYFSRKDFQWDIRRPTHLYNSFLL